MIQTMKHWIYKGYDIFLMHDSGAHWYEVEYNGKFISSCDSIQEAHMEINLEVLK